MKKIIKSYSSKIKYFNQDIIIDKNKSNEEIKNKTLNTLIDINIVLKNKIDKNININKTKFSITSKNKENISSFIDTSENKEVDSLINEQKINFNNINITSLSNSNSELYLSNLGEIKSCDINFEKIKEENIYLNNKDNSFNVLLIGKEVENENLIKNEYIKIKNNDNNTKHYICKEIYKDQDYYTQNNRILKDHNENENSIISIILSNPFYIVFLIIFICYFYPRIWIKNEWSNLSIRKNNIKIIYYLSQSIEGSNKSLYSYINYRRALYTNVRENFK